VETLANVFDLGSLLVLFSFDEKEIVLFLEGEASVKQFASWSGKGNLFCIRDSFLNGKTLSDWEQFWGTENTGSQESNTIPYQKDFRLADGSPGKGAGPGGKDIGADMDLVGPGEAYQRWKKTPEYQKWVKEIPDPSRSTTGKGSETMISRP
jgi:hypothetical protein